jgi:hypothetical protein
VWSEDGSPIAGLHGGHTEDAASMIVSPCALECMGSKNQGGVGLYIRERV